MTTEHTQQLSRLLDIFKATPSDAMDAFFQKKWMPFLQSLPTDEAREIACVALWQQEIEALDRVAQSIPQLSEAAFQHLKPGLVAIGLLEEPLRESLSGTPSPA
jgi:hypothetical protein